MHAVASPMRGAVDLQHARQRNRLGHWLHVAAGVFYLFGLGFSSYAVSWGFGVLAVVALVRTPYTIRSYGPLFRDWVGWLFIAFAAIYGVSVLWSPDRSQGLDEWKSFRAVFTAMMLWPVIEYVPAMIVGFLLGVLGQNIAQLMQAVGVLEIPLGDGPRLRGLTHPVLTATLCIVAMCWHLSAVLIARGVWRWLPAIGFLVAGVGMVLTGSRGPWIAAAVTMPVMVLVVAMRKPEARRAAVVVVVCGLVAAAASWPFVKDIVAYRLKMTQTDAELVEEGTYTHDMGYRIACWSAAWELFVDHPLTGVGAGGFRSAANETSFAKTLDEPEHAHSLYMHSLVSTGVFGGLALLTLLGAALARTWRDRWDHPFAAGSFFALLAWLICGCFDSVHLSGEMLGVFAALVTVTLPMRPRARTGIAEHS